LTKFTVDLSTLRSDDDRRDIYMRRTTLDTVRFPNAEFFLREVRGLPGPLPSSGSVPFQLVGDMTVKGVTSTVVWDVFVTLTPEGATGKATTNFPFSHFRLSIPRVPLVVSLEDNIRLELDFRLTPSG
jgi:polyisoprenoid-binding protein YceI